MRLGRTKTGRRSGGAFTRAVFVIVCLVTIVYFGAFAIWGDRGYIALQSSRRSLTQKQAELDGLTRERQRLEHRIKLVQSGDPDLLEEIARKKLVAGAPGQVVIPRRNVDPPGH